jgi:hypothetical protein
VYQQLTEARKLRRDEELAVILSGQAGPLRDLLRASPALAARFPAVIDFPGYTPGQLAAIFAAQTRPLSATRPAPRVPRQPVNYPDPHGTGWTPAAARHGSSG